MGVGVAGPEEALSGEGGREGTARLVVWAERAVWEPGRRGPRLLKTGGRPPSGVVREGVVV